MRLDAPTAAAAERPLGIAAREFRLFQALIQAEAGIHLGDAKRELLVGRLTRRLRAVGAATFAEYYALVTSRDGADERTRMIDAICTNETHFFRDARQFEYLAREVAQGFRSRRAGASRHVRIWSAACSTGQEPYSIAMTLADALAAAEGWTFEIVATDLSTRALAVAEEGVYPLDKAREIPTRLLHTYMLRGTGPQAGNMKVTPALRAMVRFVRMNLVGDVYPVRGPFDVVFCRNVLIYFDEGTRARVVRRLFDELAPGGTLFLGSAESLTGLSIGARARIPSVYGHP